MLFLSIQKQLNKERLIQQLQEFNHVKYVIITGNTLKEKFYRSNKCKEHLYTVTKGMIRLDILKTVVELSLKEFNHDIYKIKWIGTLFKHSHCLKKFRITKYELSNTSSTMLVQLLLAVKEKATYQEPIETIELPKLVANELTKRGIAFSLKTEHMKLYLLSEVGRYVKTSVSFVLKHMKSNHYSYLHRSAIKNNTTFIIGAIFEKFKSSYFSKLSKDVKPGRVPRPHIILHHLT